VGVATSTRGVETAYSSRDTLRAAIDLKPDIALLDIGLPDMDSYPLARRMRDDAALRSVRLIAITGYGQRSDTERSRAAGFAVHLMKPVDLSVLHWVLAG